MRDWDAELREILADPLFDDVQAVRHRSTADERLKRSFLDVLEFIEGNNRFPSEDGEMEEATLTRTLKSILEDILNDPLFADESSDASSIFVIPDYMQRQLKERAEVDSIYVINPGGYIGSSARSEIEYALAHGKTVLYLEKK